jgi:hypothetical protein
MADVSRATLRCLLLQDPRITEASLWAAQSTYTQADPRAGVPEPQAATALVLAASGVQTASTQVQVRTVDPGLGGDGSFLWKLYSDTLYQGWETPITISGWEAWAWDDGTALSGARAAINPHAITLSDGTILAVAQVEWRTAAPPGTTYQVRAYRRNASTGVVSSVMVREVDSVTDGLYPCLCLLPSGRVMCYSWLEAAGQLYVNFSDDGGLTWSVATRHGLRVAISSSLGLGRLRACYGRGQVALFATTIDAGPAVDLDNLSHYCSTDDGVNFDRVGLLTATSTDGSALHDVVWVDSAFLVVIVPRDVTLPVVRRIPSADSDISDWTATATTWAIESWGIWSAGTLVDGDLSLVLADDGTVYMLGRQIDHPDDQDHAVVGYSRDGGRTWEAVAPQGTSGLPIGAWWVWCDDDTHPRNLAGTWQHGRIAVLHNFYANPGDEDDSLCCAYLGGYSACTMQNYIGSAGRWPDQASWSLTYLPFDLPGDCGWTTTSAGGTEGIALGYLNLVSAGPATTVYYHQHPTGSVAEGMQAEAYVKVISGGSNLAGDCVLRLRLDDGASWYQAAFYLSAAGLDVWDEPTGSIGSAVVALTSGVALRIAIQGGKCSAWYRVGSQSDEKRTWVKLVDGATITDNGAAGAGTNLIEFGHVTGATVTSRWYQVCEVSDSWAATTLAAGQNNVTGTQGRLYSVTPEYVAEGVSIAASSGPTMLGDLSYISTAYGYPVSNIFPEIEPSPRIGWRSLDDSTQATIAVRLDPNHTADSGPGNDIIGAWLSGVNFREVRLQGYSGAAWTTLLTIYTDSGLSGLHFTRTGNTIQSDGTTAGPYIHADEFAGASFVFDDGTIRRISHNTEGSLGVGHKRACLILEGVNNPADPASGVAGAIRSTWVCGLVKLNGADYTGYRLLIPVHDTIDGDFRIGTMLLGWAAVLGFEPSWDRSVETQQNRDETEAADWTRTVRTRAPSRRLVDLSWTDGVDTSGAFAGDPDYLLDMAAGVAVASHRDTPYLIEGLVRSLAGPGKLVAYLPSVPYAGTTATLNRRWQGFLGEVVSQLSVDTVQGEEGSTEVVRVPTLSIREVV